ncbi:MAG: hypothetical protein RMJ67_03985 [Elusimicrobiota bacterium]|nr:hypothetical protein [Endomicrobiia bacterium]MDW8165651.1 hypothetical protein [Elusimicrobiota bacterium]
MLVNLYFIVGFSCKVIFGGVSITENFSVVVLIFLFGVEKTNSIKYFPGITDGFMSKSKDISLVF